jgi:hypothetical protein
MNRHSLNKQIIHFLHIGKTGGTAVKYALENTSLSPQYSFFLHDHSVKLRDIPYGEKVFFFLRDPITRFVSGFYSRQRQGKPRYNSPWSKQEEAAFLQFKTPNDLAISLTSETPKVRESAFEAMINIQHVNSFYMDWFGSEEYFNDRLSNIFFIGFQESLDSDFELLKIKTGLPPTVSLPRDSLNMHQNPAGLHTQLAELAVTNLKKWYEKDYFFLNLCKEHALLCRVIKKQYQGHTKNRNYQ